ncbi:MAG: hypothetical protein ABUT20_55285 [Bacteroidota bacterium]
MTTVLQDNKQYFADVSSMISGKPVTVNEYKLSRKNAFVSLANLSDAFNRMLSEPKNKQKNIRELHQFVVSNHMLTSHIATLAYYEKTIKEKISFGDFSAFRASVVQKLDNAKLLLQHRQPEPETPGQRENLRVLNNKINSLTEQRKAELKQGITVSNTRKELSALKPVADQFNFISKIAGDLEKLSSNFSEDSHDQQS